MPAKDSSVSSAISRYCQFPFRPSSRINAETALAWGLVNRITPAGKNLVDDAIEWIAPIANGAPIAQSSALAAIDASFDSPLDQGLLLESHFYDKTLVSEDRREALKAFAEKRKPEFKNK